VNTKLPDPANPPDFSHFWPSLLSAVGAEPRDLPSLRGASGINHEFAAVGADEKGRRLVVISGESDAAGAAMAQADIQAAMREVSVIVARPIVIDLASVGKSIEQTSGKPILTAGNITQLQQAQEAKDEALQAQLSEQMAEWFGPLAQQIANARAVGSISFLQGLGQLMEQLTKMKWQMPGDDPAAVIADFSKLLTASAPHTDSQLGVCGIPVYEFSSDELEVIHSGSDHDAIQTILRDHDIIQYFYPAPDQTALGLIDRGQHSLDSIGEISQVAPEIGHPYGSSEIVNASELPALIDELQERKLLVEGEFGYELTAEGEQQRATVRFKPREGLISKIINRVTVKVNLKNIIRIG
jgi:ribosomal protein S6E (S10)